MKSALLMGSVAAIALTAPALAFPDRYEGNYECMGGATACTQSLRLEDGNRGDEQPGGRDLESAAHSGSGCDSGDDSLADEAGDTVDEAGDEISAAADEAGDEIEGAADEAGDEIGDVADEAGNEIDETADEAGEVADEAGDEISEAANEAGEGISEAADDVADAFD
jgi:gas vesicle protein